MIARNLFAVAILGLIAFLLVSCDQTQSKKQPAETQVSGAGATFPAPLYKKWIEAYEKTHKETNIEYDPVGSGEGIKRFVRNEVDFGASDAAMTDEQMAAVKRGVKLIPATAGIVTLAYNLKDVHSPLKLPRDVYVDIFWGKITRWNDPRIAKANPGVKLPDREIFLVVRQDSSGTTYAFTNHLSAINREWRNRGPQAGKLINWPAKTMVARGNEGVAARIKISEGAIGYVEYGYAQRAGLSMALLENKSGNYVQPLPEKGSLTLANTAQQMPESLRMFFPDPDGKDSYPIVTYSWIMLYDSYPDLKKGSAVKDFVKWGISEGQKYGSDFGYCPLPKQVAQLGAAAVDKVK